ncbi:helix-hairpin-helix domain-containing protein [Haemophilus paraphrohaemolyticus]|uniref:Helix-hairpin-helix domain-containing protein n=1 Tax=Haemophilus paraphrohaemolyticus TaxID=736 RepID=A0A369ZTL9_9PAST|nr:helix-hairpin-helix domain-containing protein [Haemophilus paraphrohaemolyticus]RDF10853.1 helix-hairpin-helix domain-containing protein [Haemophilus paraphrohaemolyticus]
MKKINTFATSLMIGLFSTAIFANEVTTQPTAQPAQTTVVTAPAASTAPVSIQQVAVDPNAVNINTASAAEIQDKLVGIGAKKAQAIVDYRTKNGAFLSIEQLKEVSGIGAATLEKNRSRIVL